MDPKRSTNIPKHLFEWKKRGFVAYDIYTDGFHPVNALSDELRTRCMQLAIFPEGR